MATGKKRARTPALLTAAGLVLLLSGAFLLLREVLGVRSAMSAHMDTDIWELRPEAGDTDWSAAALQAVNPDITGWIAVPGTGVDYPLLYDDASVDPVGGRPQGLFKYLHLDYRGRESEFGSITVDFRCDPALADGYTVIYGHNLDIAGVMFSDLKRFETEDFFDTHPTAWLWSGSDAWELTLLCCARVRADDMAVYGMEDAAAAVEQLRACALHDSGLGDAPSARYVALSTCYAARRRDDLERLVLLYRAEPS